MRYFQACLRCGRLGGLTLMVRNGTVGRPFSAAHLGFAADLLVL